MSLKSSVASATPSPHHINLPHGTVAYQKTGQGPPLLLIHGWGGSANYWKQTIAHLTNDYTCYAIELPGYGNSPPMATSASAERLAAVVLDFANALDIPPFVINGHSFGGAVAAYVATTAPERVRSLVLTCFGIFNTDVESHLMAQSYYPIDLFLTAWQPWLMFWQPWLMTWQCWIAALACATRASHEIARPVFHHLPQDDELIFQGFTDFMCMDYRSSLESATSIANPALQDALQHITVPTLLIAANQDKLILPSLVLGARQLIPDCRVAWIDQCGHIPMVEQPERYVEILRRFLLK